MRKFYLYNNNLWCNNLEHIYFVLINLFSLFSIVGKAHLKEALNSHEEALRLHDLCKQLRKIDTFLDILKTAHDR